MSNGNGILTALAQLVRTAMGSSHRAPRTSRPRRPMARLRTSGGAAVDRAGAPRTIRVDPTRIAALQVAYAPEPDGAPDAGEIVWTWVPYEEDDGRGKDRPVLVIGRSSGDRVYAVRLTSTPHDGDRDFVPIGSGDWDSQGRESWVDVEQLYSVHEKGLRREAAVLDRRRYDAVASVLRRRYGWADAGGRR
ncbi:type II toxin-antitoxin system PemK/MazF family toxin [Microbacterium sp. 179-I 3D3 NHS]|uniref:type II toxin-antitoxin system PemK/MazF family toxin n=1 Tax=Microbacterium sp. 179-I 3D3 NHS TaxID=3142382 RepID=UPI00399FB412